MEDQPTDSGDLTNVPEGKAARRHRLPRQKLRESDASNDLAGSDTAEPVEPEIVESEAETPEVVESEAETPEAVESEPQRRRRFPWRRATTEAPPAAAAPEPAAEVESADATTELDSEADVVDESAPADTLAVESDDVPASEVGAEPASEPESPEPDPEPVLEPEPDPEPVLVAHRTAGRGLKVAVVAAGALFVGAAAFAGATLQPYLADRAEVRTKFEVADISADAITTLWTYTPDDMDTLPDRAAKYLGGDFAAEYRRYIDSIVEPNRQAQVSNATQVLGAAVESLSPTEASALVYTNSVATSPVTKGIPSLRYLSYRLSLERRDNEWLITRMTAVTSLDLTPRL